MKLPIVPLDKANHFIYGFAIYIISSLFVIPEMAFLIVLLFALGKEIRDEFVYSGFDVKDILATIFPALILLLLSIFMKYHSL